VKKEFLFLLTSLSCSATFAQPIINLHKDLLTLSSSAEIVSTQGITEIFSDNYTGYLLGNDIAVSAVNEQYTILDDWGNSDTYSTKATAQASVHIHPNAFSVEAVSEIYWVGYGQTEPAVQSVNSVYASAIVDWVFSVEGDGAELSMYMDNAMRDGVMELFDITQGNYLMETGTAYHIGGNFDLLGGHLYSLKISSVDAHHDDDDNYASFAFNTNVVYVPEPPILFLLAGGLLLLRVYRYRLR